MNTLLTDEILKSIPNLYDTENSNDPICQVKLFTPDSNWTWYIIEFSQSDNDTCYGYVQGLEDELGYFSLKEIETLKGSLSLGVEKDLSFEPTLLSIVKNQ